MGKGDPLGNARARWNLAGLTDGNAGLGKRVPAGHLFVPGDLELVTLDNSGSLLLEKIQGAYGVHFGEITPDSSTVLLLWNEFSATSRTKNPDSAMLNSMLNSFVRLWKRSEQNPAPILRYARTWGILRLNDQGQPCAFKGPFRPQIGVESISAWKYISRRAFAVLNIAAELREGKPGSKDDWGVLANEEFECWGSQGFPVLGFPIDDDGDPVINISEHEARMGIEFELNNWLKLGSVSFAVEWSEPLFPGGGAPHLRKPAHWQLQIDYDGCLFSAIALHLVTTVARGELFICSGCQFPYLRPRKEKQPKFGQRNFCEECRQLRKHGGPSEPFRQADKRRREKIREARELRMKGVSVRDIVKRLNVRSTVRSSATDTVHRWIEKGK